MYVSTCTVYSRMCRQTQILSERWHRKGWKRKENFLRLVNIFVRKTGWMLPVFRMTIKDPGHPLSSRAGGIEQGGLIFLVYWQVDTPSSPVWCLVLWCRTISTTRECLKRYICVIASSQFCCPSTRFFSFLIIAHRQFFNLSVEYPAGCDGRQSGVGSHFDSVFWSGQFWYWLHSSMPRYYYIIAYRVYVLCSIMASAAGILNIY